MAAVIAEGLEKAHEAVKSAASKNKKSVDLERDMVDVTNNQRQTTDHGVPISNTDQWLRSVDDRRTGPSLLEDQIAREKVRRTWSSYIMEHGR